MVARTKSPAPQSPQSHEGLHLDHRHHLHHPPVLPSASARPPGAPARPPHTHPYINHQPHNELLRAATVVCRAGRPPRAGSVVTAYSGRTVDPLPTPAGRRTLLSSSSWPERELSTGPHVYVIFACTPC